MTAVTLWWWCWLALKLLFVAHVLASPVRPEKPTGGTSPSP